MITTTQVTTILNSTLAIEDPMEKLNYLKNIYSWLIPLMIVILAVSSSPQCISETSGRTSEHRPHEAVSFAYAASRYCRQPLYK
ncbi:unnamed protein product [Heligmosomoides polygyrus]|uniref:G_PROTEIN_RECEP_F1_2 domain-containing protein n=1 Tax=Heligmosomoides polygyrus TaxID=6339 RepID=A0A183GMD6_HELPZ|nr:unnamed protein product [Heligmosomoides polygyrus]